MVGALVLIGSPGAGKSSVLEELATLHDIEDIPHGAIEAEQLSVGRPLLPASSWVPQLDAVLSLQRQAGRRRFLVSATVETAEDLAALKAATASELLLVVCLTASPETVAARIDLREPDHWPGKAPLIERARRLASSTPLLPGIDLVIDTEEQAAKDVAAEVFEAMRSRGMLGDGSPRRASHLEALAVAELWLRSRRGSAGIPPAVHGDDDVRVWFRDVVLPSQEVWVTDDGDDLTAMMVLDGDWVAQLYVAPEHLRRGLGSRLIRLAQSTRRELALWTFEANTIARAFYEAHGFLPSGPASADNQERTPAICYRWSTTRPHECRVAT